MHKIRLDLAELRVESFVVHPGMSARGTVAGQVAAVPKTCTCVNVHTCEGGAVCSCNCTDGEAYPCCKSNELCIAVPYEIEP